MVFAVCGLNHKTAPINIREQFATRTMVHNDEPSLWFAGSKNAHVVLSTCNRIEVYCNTETPEALLPWFAQFFDCTPDLLTPHVYVHHEHMALSHLLRVASGLDAMMVGEPQILGQVKQAYQAACAANTVDNHLQHLFQFAFNASKRIRNQSNIGKYPTSIAYTAVQWIARHFTTTADLTVFIIGSGETAALVAKYLHQKGAQRFMVASRRQESAQQLATLLTGEAYSITDLALLLPQADVVISATACPLPFINKTLVEHALHQREQRPMLFLDLALPRDIDADVNDLQNAYLYNIDDLQHHVDENKEARHAAAMLAEQLVKTEVQRFTTQQRTLKAGSMITDYRSLMHQLAQQELERALQQLDNGQCQRSVLTEFSARLVNKLMHFPTVSLRQASANQHHELTTLVQSLMLHQTPDYSA
jgi:glutamyl-tRNA reductase